MIAARKSRLFDFVVRRWVARMIRRRFHGVYLAGAEHLRDLTAAPAVVGCANHTNWWDGFVLYVISRRRLPHDIFLAMEERNLRRYRFFTRLGVFGVDLAARGGDVAALRYAVRLLGSGASSGRGSLIWMFVQGALVSDRRPVVARPGAAFLAGKSGAALVPVALRYAWLAESRPSVFVRVGPALPPGSSSEDIATSLNALLAETDRTLDPPDLAGYERVFAPGRSVHTWWDDVRRRFGGRRETFDNSGR